MSRELFGTDGVRGLAGQYPLNHDGSVAIGRAVGTLFAKAGMKVVIAGDTRESSAELIESLCEGLISVGVNVTNIGVVPTPGLAYITREDDEFVAGIMVTASHNPYQYNGVKVFDANGGKLSDSIEAKLNALIKTGVPDRGVGQIVENSKRVKVYEDFLVSSAQGLRFDGLKLALDSANGAASDIAGLVFERLGAKVTYLSSSPNGRNINDKCGATDTRALQEAVVSTNLDLGVALDGDADRLILIDQLGRQVNGDHILYILAVSGKLNGVVSTVMSNLGFEQALELKGISLERVDVGDRYVLQGLEATGFQLGGEQSGHIILAKLLATGDGILAAVQVARNLLTGPMSLSQWRDEVNLLPQALVNIALPDKTKLDQQSVREFIKEQTNELEGKGRILIRPSGTEPLARVMVEAPDANEVASQIAKKLEELVA